MKTAIIVVDVQKDFVEGGSLAVEGGTELAKQIHKYIDKTTQIGLYDLVISTQDWHIEPGDHFNIWPVHCVANTEGAELVEPLKPQQFDAQIQKGKYSDGYSGFDGDALDVFLKANGVESVDIVGIAGDYCVKETARDAVRLGYETTVIKNLTVSIDEFPLEEINNFGAGVATAVDMEELDFFLNGA